MARRDAGVLLTLLLLASPVGAVVIQVDKFDSSTAEDGLCSLREAIAAANSNLPTGGCPAGSGADTIVLTGDVTLDQVDSFSTGTPRVTSEITIRGRQHVIRRSSAPGTPDFRILWVSQTGNLTLRDIEIRNGNAPLSEDGGGVYNQGRLSVANSLLAYNDSQSVGGAIYSGGGSTLLLVDSYLGENTASVFGGAIINYGVATIIHSVFEANRSAFGGGVILNLGGKMTLDRTLVNSNDPFGVEAQGGTILLSNSGLYDNIAGGLTIGGGTVTVLHSTVKGHSFIGVTNSIGDGTLTLTGSIIALNSGPNCSGVVTDGGNNLVDDSTCAAIPSTNPTLLNLDPVTLFLRSPSVAIDAAGDCGLLTDVRSGMRDASCDIGFYEYGADDEYETSGSGGSDDTCVGHAAQFGRGERHLHTADPSDWIRFQPWEGSQYQIETWNLFGGSDTVLELWAGCTPPKLVEDDDGGGGLASKILYTATANDELEGLNVLIRDYSGSAVDRSYDVAVTCVSDCVTCPLGGGEEFALQDERILTYREIEACNTIRVSDAIVERGAAAVLGAGGSVVIDDGFEVREGAGLVVRTNPDLENLPALP